MQAHPSRYTIISGLDVFYEREPFEQKTISDHANFTTTFCRFLSLADMGGDGRGHYAFKIDTAAPPKPPANLTRSPFDHAQPEARHYRDAHDQATSTGRTHASKEAPQAKRARRLDRSDCWFCLGNAASRKHLVIHVLDEVYLALARGGLRDDHFLIIPIEHTSALGPLSPDLQADISRARQRAEEALRPLGLLPVFLAVAQNPDHHWHLHCVPVPADLAPSFWDQIDTFFQRRGHALSTLESPPAVGECYFSIQLGQTIKYHRFAPSDFFPAQIGVEALASLLGLRRDADWRRHLLPESVESEQVARLGQILSPTKQ